MRLAPTWPKLLRTPDGGREESVRPAPEAKGRFFLGRSAFFNRGAFGKRLFLSSAGGPGLRGNSPRPAKRILSSDDPADPAQPRQARTPRIGGWAQQELAAELAKIQDLSEQISNLKIQNSVLAQRIGPTRNQLLPTTTTIIHI
jgi:hypothetical protein